MGKFLLVLFAYLFGSILFGKLVAGLKGIDLRAVGSGNIGATNVSRALGKGYGALVFCLDMLKGFLPTYLAISLYGLESSVVAFVGLASVLGHMFSLFDGLKGGKGVATAFGVLSAVSAGIAFLSLAVWVVLLFWKRYVSLASIVASVSAPVFFLFAGLPLHIFLMAVAIAGLIVYKHSPNIDRLLKGQEPKI